MYKLWKDIPCEEALLGWKAASGHADVVWLDNEAANVSARVEAEAEVEAEVEGACVECVRWSLSGSNLHKTWKRIDF